MAKPTVQVLLKTSLRSRCGSQIHSQNSTHPEPACKTNTGSVRE